jgi:hypothetical protein
LADNGSIGPPKEIKNCSGENVMKGIVLALVLHTQMCPQCFNGEPCPEAQRLHDKWWDKMATGALGAEDAAFAMGAACC